MYGRKGAFTDVFDVLAAAEPTNGGAPMAAVARAPAPAGPDATRRSCSAQGRPARRLPWAGRLGGGRFAGGPRDCGALCGVADSSGPPGGECGRETRTTEVHGLRAESRLLVAGHHCRPGPKRQSVPVTGRWWCKPRLSSTLVFLAPVKGFGHVRVGPWRRGQAMTTVARAVLEVFRRAGVTTAFGLPGVHNLSFWRDAGPGTPALVVVRHEQSAVYAADGLARASGGLGVALTTTGPGAANAVAAFGEAASSGSPVLLVASEISTKLARPGVDARRAARVARPGRALRPARQGGAAAAHRGGVGACRRRGGRGRDDLAERTGVRRHPDRRARPRRRARPGSAARAADHTRPRGRRAHGRRHRRGFPASSSGPAVASSRRRRPPSWPPSPSGSAHRW